MKHQDDRLSQEIAHGKKIAGQAERIWGWDSPTGRRRANRRAEYIKNLTGMAAGVTALEIGCGTGLFTGKLLATGARITAVDLSPELLEKAREKLGEQCTLHVADAHHLPFADASFDIVYGSSILHHLQVGHALAEAYRVLKKGGRMMFAEPNMLNPQIFVQKNLPCVKQWLGDSPDETALIKRKIARQLRQAGFIDVQVFPYDFLHPLTPNLLIHVVEKLGKILEHIPLIREFAGSLIIYGKK